MEDWEIGMIPAPVNLFNLPISPEAPIFPGSSVPSQYSGAQKSGFCQKPDFFGHRPRFVEQIPSFQ